MRGVRTGIGVTLLVLGAAGSLSGATAQTCGDGYLLCLNEAPQAEEGRTWKELRCLRAYAGCMKDQALGS